MNGVCPRCGSNNPKLHPAVQHEGEVQVCQHPFHNYDNDTKAMVSVLSMYDPLLHGGAGLIAMERQRQIKQEGWSAEHDDSHTFGELSQAAHAYAEVASAQTRGASADEFPAYMMVAEGDWPFDEKCWKPSSDPVRNLVKAGALIAAEIDRLLRRKHS